eukprot:2023770-Pleurochrysis_carterae.AAC.1
MCARAHSRPSVLARLHSHVPARIRVRTWVRVHAGLEGRGVAVKHEDHHECRARLNWTCAIEAIWTDALNGPNTRCRDKQAVEASFLHGCRYPSAARRTSARFLSHSRPIPRLQSGTACKAKRQR